MYGHEFRVSCFGRFGFFFQAEDGIRDWSVTGVQTCALPILPWLPLIEGSKPWGALGQSFLDGKYDPFRKHKLRWRCDKPGDEACDLLRREDLCRRGLVWLALLTFLGREVTPAGGHCARIQHDRPNAVLLPFVGQRLGEAREAELGGTVGRGARPTLLSRH